MVTRLEQPTAGGASLVKVSVTQPAALPTSPSSPRVKVNLALGLLVGLALGVGGAVLRETLDTRVKTVAALQELIGLPTLGVLALDPDVPKHPLITQMPALVAARGGATASCAPTCSTSTPTTGPARSWSPARSRGRASRRPRSTWPSRWRRPASRWCWSRPTCAARGSREMLGLEGSVGLTDVLVGRATATTCCSAGAARTA